MATKVILFPNNNPTYPNPTDPTLTLTQLTPLLTLTLTEQGRGNVQGGIIQGVTVHFPACHSYPSLPHSSLKRTCPTNYLTIYRLMSF